MEKKNVFGLGILLIALVVIGGGIYYLYTQRENEVEDSDIVIETIETPPVYESLGDNINLTYDYLGDNTWRYLVSGTLPNPCYEIETYVEVGDDTEQEARVIANITQPTDDLVCAEVIQEVYEEGEFEATENASVIFDLTW